MEHELEDASMSERVFANLRRISHAMHNQYLAKGSQKRILVTLIRHGKTGQKKITERIGIKAGSASEVISKMEAAGLIIRTTNQDDQRAMDIDLTPQGRELAEVARKEAMAQHEQMFTCLSDEEKEELLRLTDKIINFWKDELNYIPQKPSK